ncbi:LADA_0C07140g1_1 [Lachancea dasiensis]|uniref:LADA_0C07140g1_1 n=1 Tax=Lachancea dasiensis TaxID=1072105 RepID=A0A1G4IZG4_9SACH|nr:LADA_0C07140g1_1 [Lachancea dasiensis]
MLQNALHMIGSPHGLKPLSNVVLGIGTDVVYLPRFKNLISKYGSSEDGKRLHRLLGKFMHNRELSEFQELVNGGKYGLPLVHYIAGIWATKEAVYKALASRQVACAMPPAQTIYTKLLYKTNDAKGVPRIEIDHSLTVQYPKFIQDSILNTKFLVSLSHDEDYLVSYVCQTKV